MRYSVYSTIADDLTVHNLQIADLHEAHRQVDGTLVERRQAEDFRSFVMNNLQEGLYTVDAQGRLTSMNNAATKMLGWTEEELLGREVRHFVLSGDDDRSIEEGNRKLLSVRGKGCHVRLDDHAYRCKDGSLLSVAISASPLLTGSVVEGAVIVFRDITDEKLSGFASNGKPACARPRHSCASSPNTLTLRSASARSNLELISTSAPAFCG